MEILEDYVLWMEDYPCSLIGFREADALVLCLLSYIDYSPLFESSHGTVRLRDSLQMLRSGRAKAEIAGSGEEFMHILELAAKSERYGGLILEDYQNILRDDPLQFSAVCFHDDTWSFITFRGTDSSLAGWREDFMISFTRTEAQALALQYAQKHLRPDRVWYMGGHSKGGNEALYAACLLPDEQWQCLKRLYLLDCPGLCPEVSDLSLMKRVDEKTTRIIPEYSIVGKLFEPEISDTRIVKSSASGFQQHNLSTWGIDHGKLAATAKNDPKSLWINEILDRWIGGISQEERPVFVNELFDALASGGAETLDDIGKGKREGLEAIVKNLRGSSEITRRAISELPRQMFRQGIDQLKQVKQIVEESAENREKYGNPQENL